ncbi:MAG: AAA family ATPase [Desulfobacca sp.]|nr:AAA family ATPase [Desulfobacca sp.]
MINKIHLENFMAHKSTSIELSPGVTVITGPNNIGKSAIVEALRYLLYNPAPKHIIRHGEKQAVVCLELDSGEIITWQRQDKHASYIIQQPGQEAEKYHKFGREVPEDVRSLLRLHQVETDTDSIDIHLGNQRQPIFLLDRPGSHAAGFFAASTEADYLLKMQQVLKRRTEQANKDRKRLAAELDELAEQLACLAPLDDLEELIQTTEALYNAIAETHRQLPRLSERIGQIKDTATRLAQEQQAATILGGLPAPPFLEDLTGLTLVLFELEEKTRLQQRETARSAVFVGLTLPPPLAPTADLEAVVQDTQETLARHELAATQERVLAELATPPALSPTPELADLIKSLEVHGSLFETARQRLAVLARAVEPPALAIIGELPRLIRDLAEESNKLKGLQRRLFALDQAAPPELFDLGNLDNLVQELERETHRWQGQQQAFRVMAALSSPPEFSDILELEDTVRALTQGMAEISRQQTQLAGLDRQLDQKKVEIQDYLHDVSICPLCGSPLELAHFLEDHHA